MALVGAVQISCDQSRGEGGLSKMLTFALRGGGGGSKKLTFDRMRRGGIANDHMIVTAVQP